MISTFERLMPKEFEELSNIPNGEGGEIDIEIYYRGNFSQFGETNPAYTGISANYSIIRDDKTGNEYEVWDGTYSNPFRVNIFQNGAQTNYLANEFGDIDYFIKNVKINDRESFKRWKDSGMGNQPAYWNDPNGAGQQSFKYQYRFEDIFRRFQRQHPKLVSDPSSYIID
jgi:hypothetical protein